MGAFVLLMVVFVVAFGALLVDQLTELISRIPDLIDSAIAWVNSTFSTSFTPGLAARVHRRRRRRGLDFGRAGQEFGPNLLGIVTSALGSVFGLFTFALFAFYFSADHAAPRAVDHEPVPAAVAGRRRATCGTSPRRRPAATWAPASSSPC